MKLKLQALAAAAALVAIAGSANAAVTSMDNANSSLAFVAMDDNGTKISYFADLGVLMNSFVPANSDSSFFGPQSAGALQASNVVWNFNSNTLTVNGAQQAGTFSYSSQFSSFLASAQSADMQWAVIGGDTFDNRFLTTGSPNAATATSQDVANMANVNNLYAFNGSLGTHAAGVTGSNTAAGGTDAYVGGSWFGNDGKWVGGITYSAFAADKASNKFEYLSGTTNPAFYKELPGTFTFDSAAGTLTYAVAAVPEGDGLALAMAGLGILGFVARRRKAK